VANLVKSMTNWIEILEKIKLAARAIVTVEHNEDVIVVSARPYG
jgi:hypoxanthine phosphoribosyltransferase